MIDIFEEIKISFSKNMKERESKDSKQTRGELFLLLIFFF